MREKGKIGTLKNEKKFKPDAVSFVCHLKNLRYYPRHTKLSIKKAEENGHEYY